MQVFLLKKHVLGFILDDEENEKIRRTTAGRETLADMLPKPAERGLFNISKFQCGGTKKEDVYKKFVKKETKYHKKCYMQYDQNQFHRLSLPPMEKSSESEEFRHTSSKRSKCVPLPIDMVCFICNKPDTKLCAAGVKHASKAAVDKQHVKKTTEKIKTMATDLDNKPILAKLSSGDILSNELNYHKSCYKDFVNKYNQKSLAGSNREVSLQN